MRKLPILVGLFLLALAGIAAVTWAQTYNATWTKCASENGHCAVSASSEVRYGANTSFFYKTISSSVTCSNGTFGDPLVGTVKHCDTLPLATITWKRCSSENGKCSLPGASLVRYGASSSFRYGTFVGSVTCSNGQFGDPLVGTVKHCDYIPIGSSPPPPPPPSGPPVNTSRPTITDAGQGANA